MELTQASVVLIVYIVLLIAGGLVGFIKAKSKPSLVMSLLFAVFLALAEFGLQRRSLSDILLLVLLFFFGMRFAKNKKFMPGGLMTILTLATLLIRYFVR